MSAKLLIVVPCRDRRSLIELCLPTLADSKASGDMLVLANDGSTEYGPDFLKQWADEVWNTEAPRGIEMQRRSHFALYWERREVFSHAYFTDSDCIHDPDWRRVALALQEEHDAPICLYDTQVHADMQNNTTEDDPAKNVIFRKVAPGVSYLLTREHVSRIMPVLHNMNHWDWLTPALLGHRMAISRTSYVDHIGWKGMHHKEQDGVGGGDRARNPTEWLVRKRAEVVECLQ